MELILKMINTYHSKEKDTSSFESDHESYSSDADQENNENDRKDSDPGMDSKTDEQDKSICRYLTRHRQHPSKL